MKFEEGDPVICCIFRLNGTISNVYMGFYVGTQDNVEDHIVYNINTGEEWGLIGNDGDYMTLAPKLLNILFDVDTPQ